MRIQLAVALSAAALLAPGLAPPALAADQPMPPYNPALCHQDAKGKRYVAEGVAVFAIEPDPTILKGSWQLRPDDRLTPPDPGDAIGCPGNPQQLAYFMTPLNAVFPQASKAFAEAGMRYYRFGLTPLHGYGHRALDGKPLIPTEPRWFRDNPGLTDVVCKEPAAAVIEEQGARICRWPATRDEPTTSFIVDPQRYATPAGDPFRVYCGIDAYYVGTGPHIQQPCTIGSYAMPSGLGIYFTFIPLTSVRSPDLLDRIIMFDQRLRQAITSATTADYPWREATSPNSLTKDHSR